MREMKKRNVQFGLSNIVYWRRPRRRRDFEREAKMSIQESLKIGPKGDIAWLEWDLVGEKVNKLSSPVMLRLKEVVQRA